MGFRLYLCGDLGGYRTRFFSGHAMSKNWVAVASAEHVRLGRSSGFIADRRVPRQRQLQSFTAIGVVKDGAPYQVDMGDGLILLLSLGLWAVIWVVVGSLASVV